MGRRRIYTGRHRTRVRHRTAQDNSATLARVVQRCHAGRLHGTCILSRGKRAGQADGRETYLSGHLVQLPRTVLDLPPACIHLVPSVVAGDDVSVHAGTSFAVLQPPYGDIAPTTRCQEQQRESNVRLGEARHAGSHLNRPRGGIDSTAFVNLVPLRKCILHEPLCEESRSCMHPTHGLPAFFRQTEERKTDATC